jgi:hypothetical protein
MMTEKQTWSTLIKRLLGWLNPNSPALEANRAGQKGRLVMGEPFSIPFDAAHTATAIRVSPQIAPERALAALNLPPYSAVLVIHGGAGQMQKSYMDITRQFLIESVSSLAEKHRLLVIDGGTQSGTAQIMGEAREAVNGSYSLVGVVPEGRVRYPGSPSGDHTEHTERNALNPAHSHFMLVQGSEFGDESALLVGLLRAAGRPGAAFVINGGDIVLEEAHMHCAQNNTLITLAGSGRMADVLADPASAERQQLPPSGQLHVADVTDPQGCVDLLTRVLSLPA